MNHSAVSKQHKQLSLTTSAISSKLEEIEALRNVVLSTATNDDNQLDLTVLNKLKNMLNVINLHTSSILHDLNDLQIVDGVYRENEFAAKVTQAIEGVLDMMGPHVDQLYEFSMGMMKEKYKNALAVAHAQAPSNEHDLTDELDPLNHPNFRPLRPH